MWHLVALIVKISCYSNYQLLCSLVCHHAYLLVITGFLFPPYISAKNRASSPHRMDAPASSPPIQFNSILARRTAFRLQEFFFKNTYQPHALLFNFTHRESQNDMKPKTLLAVTYRHLQTVNVEKTQEQKVQEKPSTAEQLYRPYLCPWVPDKIHGKVAIYSVGICGPNCSWAYAVIKESKICRHDLTVPLVDSSVFIGHCGTMYLSKSVFQVQHGGWPLGKHVSLKSDICSTQINIYLLTSSWQHCFSGHLACHLSTRKSLTILGSDSDFGRRWPELTFWLCYYLGLLLYDSINIRAVLLHQYYY